MNLLQYSRVINKIFNRAHLSTLMYLLIGLHAFIWLYLSNCLHVYAVKSLADSIFTLLHSNLYGKRPADYAVSPEMREIFQNASDGMATSLSPSASLSVVRTHTLQPFYWFVFVHFQHLMVFLRWVGVWGGKKWCSWPLGYRSLSSSSWSDWGSCWEGEWLTPFPPQVGSSVPVILKKSPSWDFDTTFYGSLRHGSPE